MKSIITPTNNIKTNPFPKLMIDGNGIVVSLESVGGYGQVVHEGGSAWSVGEISDGWAMSEFKDFHGSITLSND